MKQRFLLAALVVFVIAWVAHAPSLGGGWVYDDHRFVEQNPALETLDVKAYFTDPATASASAGIQHDIYRPLRTLSFAVDRAIFGLDPKGWHAVNLLLHALAAVLVLRLLTPLVRGSLWAAGAAAAVFAVHPVGVECVAWVSSRGDLQAVLLMLLALVVLEREGVWRTVLGALLTALACFAKESAVVLPALLLLRDLALPQTVSPAASGAVIPSRRTTAVRTLVLFAVVALYLALRLSVIPDPAQVSEFAGGTRMTAARGMLATLAWYGRLLVWPAGFPFDTHVLLPLGWGDPSVVLGAGLLVTLLAAGAWGLRHPSQRLLALATWGSLACLVPVSNVVIPLKALGAERFLYPVLVCIAAGVAWGITLLPARRRWMGVAAAALVVATLVPVTMWRSRAWRSDLTLWEAVLRARPTHMRAYEGLGWAFQHASPARVRDAEVAYRAYLEYNPADGKTWFLLGTVLRDAARSLKVTRPQPGIEVLGLDEKRRAVRREELRAYRVALQVWQRLGLVRGRGSPAMLQETWGNVLEAAWDVGGPTLLDAKRANDELLRLEGGDPGRVDAVLASASFPRRRARLDLAWKITGDGRWRELPEAERARYAKVRAILLADVGVDPARTDREVLRVLLPHYEQLLTEAPADVVLGLTVVAILDAQGRKDDAAALLRDLRRRVPTHPLLQGSSGGRR